MSEKLPEDVLNEHFDLLRQQGKGKARLLETDPQLHSDTASLFDVVHLLWDILQPVPPETSFRRQLHDQLVSEAERQRVHQALGIGQLRRSNRPLWLVPVAALGTASIVGAYAYWRVRRQSAATESALAA